MRVLAPALVAPAVLLAGCMPGVIGHPERTKIGARDQQLLDKAPYAKVAIAERFQPHIVKFDRTEKPGSVVVDSDARYLYYVLPEGTALRYGVAVGEEALAFSGVAKVGHKQEWPSWVPTPSIKKRIPGTPDFVGPGPHNPLGARAVYLYQNGRDTLYRIHGTNQPEYIGQAISSGCIRMTNEAVIDLYRRVKIGATVVVLEPKQGISRFSQRIASANAHDG